MADLRIADGSYSTEAPVAIQECLNMYPQVESPGAQARVVLKRFPGLRLLVNLNTGPIRGAVSAGDFIYSVSGAALFKIDVNGTKTNLGAVWSGTTLVSMATDGTNVIMVDGSAVGYVWNGTTLAAIADVDFRAASVVHYIDGYFLFLSTDSRQFFISDLDSATSFTGDQIDTKKGSPDKIESIITSHRDVILFGKETTESWRNTGNVDFPFARQQGTFQERGCLGLNTPAQLDNTVYFLGDDGIVYSLRGYRPTRISHHGMEKWLSGQTEAVLSAGIGLPLTHAGHFWYVLSFSTGTWVYDATTSGMTETRQWFQLQTYLKDNWQIQAQVSAHNREYVGDVEGNLLYLDADTLTQNSVRMIKRRTTPYYHQERRPLSCKRLELAFEEGVATAGVPDPQVILEISRDWGRTWGNRRLRSMGALGKYKTQAVWRRNGSARGFVFRWTVTDDVDVTFVSGHGEFDVGTG